MKKDYGQTNNPKQGKSDQENQIKLLSSQAQKVTISLRQEESSGGFF
jgi:hypothetical protein